MVIYKITNLKNDKCYIGQTVHNIEYRFYRHCVNSNSAISLAIKKYGKSNFKLELIATAGNVEELNSLEQFYIKYFNSLSPFGYNLKSGGNQCVKYSEESRSKMKNSHRRTKTFLGKKHTEESKNKIRSKLLGNIPGNKGKSHSDETKLKIGLKSLGRPSSNKGKCKYFVIGPNVKFNTIQEAAKYYNVTTQAIILRCKRRNDWKLVPNV